MNETRMPTREGRPLAGGHVETLTKSQYDGDSWRCHQKVFSGLAPFPKEAVMAKYRLWGSHLGLIVLSYGAEASHLNSLCLNFLIYRMGV